MFVCLCISGVKEQLATHIAHLFVRDPLVLFLETLDNHTDLFEVRWSVLRSAQPRARALLTSVGVSVTYACLSVGVSK